MARHGDADGDGVADAAQAGMSAQTLRTAMGASLPLERYIALLPGFTAAMIGAGCTTPRRAAMWCAQLGHESSGLKYMQEIASGSAYNGRKDLGNTQPGDGPRFKGHGPIQITGRHNHSEVSKWAFSKGLVSSPTYFVDNPNAMASDSLGFIGAVWYWTVARPRINAMCDQGDIVGVTKAINGGTNGLADRTNRYNACLKLGNALLPRADMVPSASTRNRKPLGTEMVMDPIGFTGKGSRRIYLDPPGAWVIERAWFSWAIDGPPGATATARLYPQKPGGGTGAFKDVKSTALTDGSNTVTRDPFEVPRGTDQITVQYDVPIGSIAYLVPAFRAAS